MSANDCETFVELRCMTAFSFLRGASQPDELVGQAAALGYRRLAITDREGLHGVVRAHRAGKEAGVEILVGTEIPACGDSARPRPSEEGDGALVLLATDRASYGRLSLLLSEAKLRVGKGGFQLEPSDLARHAEGLMAIHAGPPDPLLLAREKELFGDRLSLAIERNLSPYDRIRIEAAQSASMRFGIPLVATSNVLMHDRARKPVQDILSCIRLGVRIDQAGRRLMPNASAYLRSPEEMSMLFRDFPEALARSVEIADQCRFRLSELSHHFALEILPTQEIEAAARQGLSMDIAAQVYLRKLVEKGAAERYPSGVPEKVRAQIEHELALIDQLHFAGYFLTVWDIVRFARSQNILCQGRGSAANSVVCYVLGITAIDPVRMELLFERFISAERGEPPDIDVDFEHERREEVMQYVYEKYGRDHAALVATVITYRGRSAFREVGKVFGLGEDQLDRLSDFASGLYDLPLAEEGQERVERHERDGRWSPPPEQRSILDELRAAGLDPDDRTIRQVLRWAHEILGLPRHLGQHTGGFLITREPVTEMVPIENASMPLRTVIAWDKDDIESLGFYKIDLLSLGMLTAIRRAFHLIRAHEGIELSLANIPAEDPAVYDMVTDADTIGTFQVESRAQMQMLPRLKPRTFYDLVVSIAIIRPGPIQGDMIHPYLRRRDGLEPIVYPHPALEEILGRTYGVPLFQEQVMKMAIRVAGFSGGEADELRRAIGWRSSLHIERMRERLITGMRARGIAEDYAQRIFRMIQGFGNYGFPESHAASFALLAYASCYLKRYHPAALLAGLLNSQPMGFYAPNTLIQDALRHGVEVRPLSVVKSEWGAILERGDAEVQGQWWAEKRQRDPDLGLARHAPAPVTPAVRLGLQQVRGMSEAHALRIIEARQERPFESIADLVDRAHLPRDAARNLATAGAFEDLEDARMASRREALWRVAALGEPATLFSGVELPSSSEAQIPLAPMSAEELLQADYRATGVSVGAHPVALARAELDRQGILGTRGLARAKNDARVRVGGLAITRQRPSTASGVVFITLEDEDGHMNLVVFPQVYERHRALASSAAMLIAEGKVQRTGAVLNVIVEGFEPLQVQSRKAVPKGRHDHFGHG